MAVTITAAELVAVQPEWTEANTGTPDVVEHAVDQANALTLELYTDETQERHRRYLEAGAVLFSSPFARDMKLLLAGDINPYRSEAQRLDRLKGTSERAPGWTIPGGAV